MTYRDITIAVILGGIGVWIVWDIIVAFFNKEKRDTISAVIVDWAVRRWWAVLLIPLSVGVLLGHWLWPQNLAECVK